jgi:hypothetical protein
MAETPLPAQCTALGRNMGREDRIHPTSAGLDIASSASHLIFSRLGLEREGGRSINDWNGDPLIRSCYIERLKREAVEIDMPERRYLRPEQVAGI